MNRTHTIASAAGLLLAVGIGTAVRAQVSAYTFTQEIGTWQPIAGSGTPLGMPNMPWPFTFDDNSFVTQGDNVPIGTAITGTGWPIGFTFNFNGHPYDRVGISMEGWIAFGHSSDGANAVYVPTGAPAYTPLSAAVPAEVAPARRNRIAAFSMDLAALGAGGTWPVQTRTAGVAPNRMFIVEWNVVRSGGSNLLNFQIRLNEGGGDPAAQTVQTIYGTMTQSAALLGQVGLGGLDPSDFNNRAVTASPFNWQQSQPGTANTATCRPPSAATNIPQGLTFTWTPPACVVNGIAVSGLAASAGSATGTLSWRAVTGATTYDYIITTGGPDDPVVASGTGITGTSVQLAGLPVDANLVAYVKADCAEGEPGWGAGFSFTTRGVVEVVCGNAPLAFTHCYVDLEESTWHFRGTSDAPLRLIMHEGVLSVGDLLVIYDGPTDASPVLFSSANGVIAGQIVNSTGPELTMKLVADNVGSCAVHGVDPMQWEVGCVDCDPVFAGFQVVDDCEQGRFTVGVQLVSMGDAPQVVIGNDAGVSAVTVSAPGLYTVGPFTNGTPVIVTAAHASNPYCSMVSTVLINGACPLVSCGPDTHVFCYDDNENDRLAYRGEAAGDRIGIRFVAGSLANGDVLAVYDGLDEFMSTPLGQVNGGDLTGRVFTTSAASNTIMLHVRSDGSQSCASGHAAEWNYIVACHDGCTAPAAQFTVVDDCAAGRFNVVVDITSIGSAGQVLITNDAGVPQTTASATGQYTVGPFTNGTPVVITLEGASLLCSLNSNALDDGCGVGIPEIGPAPRLMIYPDPGEGAFNLVPPRGFGGGYEVEVLDLAGRRVQLVRSNGPGGPVIPLDLADVPTGSYVVVLRDRERAVSGTVRVMR
ncbi:MAG: T9SS type A sorting domain-containing protein [Flavobacteriales bacterium]|nr:T9SS type A sorting domain-containing protein [Flavobacteriales bacterium]